MEKKLMFQIIITRSLIIIKEFKKLQIRLFLKITWDKKKAVLNVEKKDI